ncbi:MAG: pyrroline-5-carboxylate reductase [Lachnospiraceae bacterium]|nr:pyrroline-5-carboxylate reductase [Lachnospiraceae bacterium]
MKKMGFIGMGNMAQALAAGFLRSGFLDTESLYAYAPNQDKLYANAKRIGFTACGSAEALAEACDTLVIACKPYQLEAVCGALGEKLAEKAVISVAAGWPYEKLAAVLPESARIQFVMPNTPAMVGEGVLLFEERHSLQTEEREQIMQLFSSVGLVKELPSHLMGIGGALTGCGPAFVDLFLEAYADAAVKYGISRADAYQLAAKMVSGSAKLQLETGLHPAVLKDQVCSPAGTTICGVAALEENGFRHACIASIDAVMHKS